MKKIVLVILLTLFLIALLFAQSEENLEKDKAAIKQAANFFTLFA